MSDLQPETTNIRETINITKPSVIIPSDRTKPSVLSARQRLNEYFDSGDFQLTKGKEEQSLQLLRKYMETVYHKERPLVAIDVEAWEKSLKKVTEIGISVYDPRNQHKSPFPLTKTVHLVVKENINLNNGKYVPDNKRRFMGGSSKVLNFAECTKFVQAVVEQYINVDGGVLVGHQIDGDIKWLKSIGVKLPDDVECVDTLKLYSFSRSSGGTLRGILRKVGIPHAYLHNAANDAYYTLLAALAYCDPAFRTHYKLDTWNGATSHATTAEKKLAKFLDLAKFDSKTNAEQLYKDLFAQDE